MLVKVRQMDKTGSYLVFVVEGRFIEDESSVVWRLCRWIEESDEEAKK
jgi:hypothetical protein